MGPEPSPLAGRRLLILTLGTRGDVQPFIVLAQALQQAGALPLLATAPHFAPLGAAHGVQIVSILEQDDTWPEVRDLEAAGAECKQEFEEILILAPYERLAPGMLRRVEQLAALHRPDVVIVGMIIWFVQWLRVSLGRPLVHVHLQPMRWLTTEDQSQRLIRGRRFLDVLARAPLLDVDFIHARLNGPDELHLLAYPASLSVTHLPGAPSVRTGFWTHDADLQQAPPPEDLAAFLRERPAPVCLNFGSMPVYSRTSWIHSLLAVLEQHCRNGGRLLAIGDLVPQNVRSWPGTQWVASAPHTSILPHCACVVHHGGAGTCAAAIAARTPSLVVPHLTWIDQNRWARWIEAQSAGVHLRAECRSEGDFAAALNCVLTDSSIRSGVQALASKLDADGGAHAAVRAIAAHLASADSAAAHAGSGQLIHEHEQVQPGSIAHPDSRQLSVAQLVLMARDVSDNDTFTTDTPLFELNSLELIEFFQRIELSLGRQLPRLHMLEQRTISSLAAKLSQAPLQPTAARSSADPALGWGALLTGPRVSSVVPARSEHGRRQRCLFLHGEAASADLQRLWLERSGWLACFCDADVELLLLDAPLPVGAREQTVPPHALAEYLSFGRYYSWGSSSANGPLQVALRHIEQALEHHAPIHAIAGFSQGALAAAAVIAAGKFQLGWYINLCGMPWQWLHMSTRTSLPLISVPSLHLVSDADPLLSSEEIHSLPSRCVSPTVVVHSHGHALPPMDLQLASKVKDFLAMAVVATRPAVPSTVSLTPEQGWQASSRSQLSDAFLWRKMVERQKRWYEHEPNGQPCRDQWQRFVPTPSNPLQQLSPQDKLMERRYLDQLGIQQARLLAVIREPNELLALSLPSSFVIKPVGAAYSEGIQMIKGGKNTSSGLPWNLWEGVQHLKKQQAMATAVKSATGRAVTDAMQYNYSSFLIEEFVQDEAGNMRPTDYRIYVNGDTVLWIELTIDDPAILNARQAAVTENYELYPPAFDANEMPWAPCTSREQLPSRPVCWEQMLQQARTLGAKLGVLARLDWYADKTRGPLLGEITLTPNMGQTPALYAPWVNAITRAHWRDPDGVPQRTVCGVRTLIDALDECSHGILVPWSATEILDTVERFNLSPWGVQPGERVGMLLPTGPHAALCLLAIMSRYCAVPLDPLAPSSCTTTVILRLGVTCLLSEPAHTSPLGRRALNAAQTANVPFIPLDLTKAPGMVLPKTSCNSSPPTLRLLSDTVLILSTSGTTGQPKGVPFSLARLLASGRALAHSLDLGTGDVGINMGMPLHHVGGIAGNIMAPLVSRGRMVFGAAFSPQTWVQRATVQPPVSHDKPTVSWCYQVSSMWCCVARLYKEVSACVPRHHLRVLRSGASHLPHPDATHLASLFGCPCLPTYSMTECMPIASPPLDYQLERPGSVGRAIGDVTLAILAERNDQEQTVGALGEIALRGGKVLFCGYDREAALSSGWFRTGDLGHIDESATLYITGRCREMINRGGEVISPTQVEDALACHPSIKNGELMVFAAPHDGVQEVVGVAVTTSTAVELRELRTWARTWLPVQALPLVLVAIPSLPKTSTGKLQRTGFHRRVRLPVLSGSLPRMFVYHPAAALLRERTSAVSVNSCHHGTEKTELHREALGSGGSLEGESSTIIPTSCVGAIAEAYVSQADDASHVTNNMTAAELLRVLRTSRSDTSAYIEMDTELLLDAFDSLAAVNVVLKLRELTAHPLPLTLLWECPTPASVVQFVLGLQSKSDGGSPLQVEADSGSQVRGSQRPCCLFLHGMAANAELMDAALTGAGWKELSVDFVLVDALHPSRPKPEMYAPFVAAGLYGEKTSCFDYGLDHENSETLVRESVEHIEALIERHGATCIGGICDGGLLAALVAARHPELRLLINVCGSPWGRLPLAWREYPAIEVPSVHLLGRQDLTLSEEELFSLSSRCNDAVVLRHPQGHAVPALSSRLAARLALAFRTSSSSLMLDGSFESGSSDAASDNELAASADQLPDSIQMLLRAGIRLGSAVNDHVYFACLVFVVVGHWSMLWRDEAIEGTTPLVGNCVVNAGRPDSWCGTSLAATLTIGGFFAMQAFVVFAGVTDARLPDKLMRRLAMNTAIVVCIYTWLFFFSGLPEFLAKRLDTTDPDWLPLGVVTYHREIAWFGVFLLSCRVLHAMLATCKLRFLLPALGVMAHFGCRTGCSWPFRRDPFDMYKMPLTDPLLRLAVLLPQTGKFSILFIYYATVPLILPADFPRALPDPLFMLRMYDPADSKRYLKFIRKSRARGFWVAVFLALWTLSCFPEPRRTMINLYDAAHRGPHGCLSSECDSARWSRAALVESLGGLLLSFAAVVGLASVVPRRKTVFSWAGGRSFQVYVLHDYVMTKVGPIMFQPVGLAARVLHKEMLAVVVLSSACVLVIILAAVPLERLPPLIGPWIDCLKAARSISDEKVPLFSKLPPSRASSHRVWRRTTSLFPLLALLAILWPMGGIKFGSEISPLVAFAMGREEACERVRDVMPPPLLDIHGKCNQEGSAIYARHCLVLRACPALETVNAKMTPARTVRKSAVNASTPSHRHHDAKSKRASDGHLDAHPLVAHSLDMHPRALCNDGSRALYYYAASMKSSNVWLVYLSGFGMCYSADSCAARCRRAKGMLCSNRFQPQARKPSGLLNAAAPHLRDAHRVYLPYCSSDAFLGNSTAFGLEFRGQAIVEAVFAELVSRHGLGRQPPHGATGKSTIVLGGANAGAVGAMAHLDYVHAMLGTSKTNHVRVVGLIDSVLTLKLPLFQTQGKSAAASGDQLLRLANEFLGSDRHDAACSEAMQGEVWKCLSAQYRLPWIRAPYLLIEPQYNAYELDAKGVSLHAKAPQAGLKGIDAEAKMAYAVDYAHRLVQQSVAIQQAAAERNRSVALFLPACLRDAMSEHTAIFNEHRCSGETMNGALSKLLRSLAHSRHGHSLLSYVDPCGGADCGLSFGANTCRVMPDECQVVC